jgi:hypothetical protein
MKVVLPVSLDKFFELFLSDEAVYSFSHHRALIGGNFLKSKFSFHRYGDLDIEMAADR